jgi:Zn finger protein HypA/HybF involved in hydrogenase expression
MVDYVLLKCPKCKREKLVDKQPTDPAKTHEVQLLCPDCNRGDFAMQRFFDRDGNELRPE